MVSLKMINLFPNKAAGRAGENVCAVIIGTSLMAGCTTQTSILEAQPARVYFSHAFDNYRVLDDSKLLRPGPINNVEEDSSGSLPEIVLRFDNDSAQVRDEDIERLQSFVLNFGTEKMPAFIITGHTDSNHSDEYNDELSQRRAVATQQQMKRMGVPLSRMTLRAFGESFPEANNSSANGRQINRRVTVQISN